MFEVLFEWRKKLLNGSWSTADRDLFSLYWVQLEVKSAQKLCIFMLWKLLGVFRKVEWSSNQSKQVFIRCLFKSSQIEVNLKLKYRTWLRLRRSEECIQVAIYLQCWVCLHLLHEQFTSEHLWPTYFYLKPRIQVSFASKLEHQKLNWSQRWPKQSILDFTQIRIF